MKAQIPKTKMHSNQNQNQSTQIASWT